MIQIQDSNHSPIHQNQTGYTPLTLLLVVAIASLASGCGGASQDESGTADLADGGIGQAALPLSGDSATFVADVTIPDHTAIDAGTSFVKTWRLRNSGTHKWSAYKLCYASGELFNAVSCVGVPTTAPGATAGVSVSLWAPPGPTCAAKGHAASWTLRDTALTAVPGGTVTVVITVNPTSGSPRPNLKSSAYAKPANPFAASGWGGQCTAFAWGRMYEKTGKNLAPRGNGGTWYSAVPATSRSTTPRANSVAVWTGGTYGHVAFVESVTTDAAGNVTSVTFSEANFSCLTPGGWGGGYDGAPETLSLANFKAHYGGFAGVIF